MGTPEKSKQAEPNTAHKRGKEATVAKQKTAGDGTLGLNVEQDEVGKAAEAYLKACDAAQRAKDKQAKACSALVAIMREKKRRHINVKGKCISLRHVDAQDQIKVKKASDK